MWPIIRPVQTSLVTTAALKADTGTILGIIALVLMLQVTYIANMTTPMLADWISRRSKVSLGQRIAKIELSWSQENSIGRS